MSANETQIGGTHYTDMDVQPWEAMRAWMTPEQFCGYLLGTAVAYLARVNATAAGKGGLEDIEKARHVLTKLSETWNYRVFKQFPKEVMQFEGHSDPQYPATTPAVSESAAGELARPDWSQAPEWAKHWCVDADLRAWWFEYPAILVNNRNWHVQKGRYDSAPIFCYAGHWMNAKSDRPATDWLGPDWSQAPEWAMWWAADSGSTDKRVGNCYWTNQKPDDGEYIWSYDHLVYDKAPTFGYTGHWRDSLRKRPR